MNDPCEVSVLVALLGLTPLCDVCVLTAVAFEALALRSLVNESSWRPSPAFKDTFRALSEDCLGYPPCDQQSLLAA